MSSQGESVPPPPSNTGVQTPGRGRGLVVTTGNDSRGWHVDWLELTFPVGTSLGSLIPGVEESEWEAQEHGRLGYKRRYQARGAEALVGGTDAMGVHLTLGGTCIRYLCATFGTPTLASLLARGACGEAAVSRVDFAIDTVDGSINSDVLLREWQAGHVTSRWDSSVLVRGGKRGSMDLDGWTFYVGAATSDARCRIYDKAAERRAKGKREEALARQMPERWVRIEYQLRNQVAQAAVRLLETEGQAALASAFLGYLAFRVPSQSARPERWPVADWWAAALGTVEARPMRVPRPDGDLEATRVWVVQQAAPSLAALMLAAGGDVTVAKEIALAGANRLSPKLVARLKGAGVIDTDGNVTWQGARTNAGTDVPTRQAASQVGSTGGAAPLEAPFKVVPLDPTTLRPRGEACG